MVNILEFKWLGHASWKLKTGGKTIYVDPYEGEYTEEADLILSTHIHQDHCDPEKIGLIKGPNTIIVAPEDCGEKVGPVTSLKPGETYTYGDIEIEAVEAYNYKRFRSPGTPFHPRGLGVGYLVKAEGKVLYHVGDSDFIDEMKQLKNVDLLVIPSGGTYTMDGPEAAEATIAMNPRKAVPVHLWDTDPNEYKKQVEKDCDTEVIIIKPGETIIL